MTLRPWTLLLPSLLLAACGGSSGGNDSNHGNGGDGGADCTQAECMAEAGDYWEVDSICLPGGCTSVGRRDPYGELLRGSMLIGVETERVDARTISSAYLRVFYPKDTVGGTVDCDRILNTPDRLDDRLNVVGYYTTSVRSMGYMDFAGMFGPVAGLPVNDRATAYVVHVAMYSGDRDAQSHDPTGVVMAEGCLPGLVVAPGEPLDWGQPDAAHLFGTVTTTAP